MWSVYPVTWCVQSILQPHYSKTSTQHDAQIRISARDIMCCIIFRWCVGFCCSIHLSVCHECKTEVNHGLSLAAIMTEIQSSNQNLTGTNSTHNHATTSFTSFSARNWSKADLASTAVTASGVHFIAWKIIMVNVWSYIWPHCLNWEEYVCNLHKNCIPEVTTLN